MRAKLVDENVATVVPNPESKRLEIQAFATLAELDSVGAEMDARFAAIPVFASLTGLRPQEWMALERKDVDQRGGVVHVRRVVAGGKVRLYGKQARTLRAVPLPLAAAQALDAHPARLDTPLLFPTARGALIDLHTWREDHWNPALNAAGLAMCACGHLSGEHEAHPHRCGHDRCRCSKFKRLAGYRTPYAMRHTFATFSVAAGVSLFELARFMGTSVEQIDETYGHLLPDALDRARTALDSFLAAASAAAAGRLGTY